VDLYLVRHAIAEDRDSARWPDDSVRPLTAEGVDRFRRAARGLREVIPRVDAVLSSGFARAWHTAELLEEEAGWPAPRRSEPLESGQSPVEAVRMLQKRDEAALALVGHEPHLSWLAALLLAGDEDGARIDLKKGGAIALALPGHVEAGTAVLIWAATPRMLRRLGR
jgi:phosphohistidine phosphatase